jgi:hypothetical protein
MTIQNLSISSIAYKELTWEMKVMKVYENEIVVMSPYILWEQVSEFINGQGWGKKRHAMEHFKEHSASEIR